MCRRSFGIAKFKRRKLMRINRFVFDELRIGQKEFLETEIQVKDIEDFSAISGDYSPIHVDSNFAKQKGLSDKISHGLLIGAKVSGFIGMLLPGENGILKSCDFEFRNPLMAPEEIKISGEIIAISQSTRQVEIDVIVANKNNLIFLKAKVKSIIRL